MPKKYHSAWHSVPGNLVGLGYCCTLLCEGVLKRRWVGHELASCTTGAGVKSKLENEDRRGADRFPIEREVRYKILNRKGTDEVGHGKTINMSSNGVLFATDQYLLPGQRLELSISWPAQLNSTVALKLIVRGRVVRCEDGKVGVEIHQHEFRTAKPSSITNN